MSKSNYKTKKARNHIFYFKYDDNAPELLHIYVRHLKTPNEAMNIFFNGESTYNKINNRCETFLNGNGIYWFWLDKLSKKVLIISCFSMGENI